MAAGLAAFAGAAVAALRGTTAPAWERIAFVTFLAELGALSAQVWAGHADLRSIDEVYTFALLILLGSRRRLGPLALCAGLAIAVAAAHQVLHLQ